MLDCARCGAQATCRTQTLSPREVCTMVPDALVSTLPFAESFEPAYLEYWGILPLVVEGDRLRVAAAAEPGREVVDDLELTYGRPVELVVASREEVVEGIRRTFAASESVLELIQDLDAELGPTSDIPSDQFADARDLANQPPVNHFVKNGRWDYTALDDPGVRAGRIDLVQPMQGARDHFDYDVGSYTVPNVGSAAASQARNSLHRDVVAASPGPLVQQCFRSSLL